MAWSWGKPWRRPPDVTKKHIFIWLFDPYSWLLPIGRRFKRRYIASESYCVLTLLYNGDIPMKVSDILRVKGNTLYTVRPDDFLSTAARTMSEMDIGSLVVMEHGEICGMLTFREVIHATVRNEGAFGSQTVRSVMDDHPLTCTPDTEIDEVRRMMLSRHARYMPVLNQRTLIGVVSFYDVAKAVVDGQDFENRMLKAYIRDWPSEEPTEERQQLL
jgi:CBS domain-containing protein